MKKFRVWTSRWELFINADKAERTPLGADDSSFTTLQFFLADGTLVAEIDRFDGWSEEKQVQSLKRREAVQ